MKRAVVSILIVIALTYVVRDLLYAGIRMNRTGEYGKLNTLFLEHNTYNCLIVGSSRAESHFNTRIIDSITGLNSFNAGLEGATMPFILGSLEAYLEHSDAPKYVILNLDIHSFSDNNDTIHRFPRYFPYLSNKKLYECLSGRDPRFPWFRWIPFYSLPYFNDRYLDASVRGYLNEPNDFDRTVYNGYAPVPEGMQQDVDTIEYRQYTSVPPPVFFGSIQRIIDICKDRGSRLLVVISPLYIKKTQSIVNKEMLEKWMRPIWSKAGVRCVDFTQAEMCNNKLLFADPNHLNKAGSEKFSAFVSRAINQYMDLRRVDF